MRPLAPQNPTESILFLVTHICVLLLIFWEPIPGMNLPSYLALIPLAWGVSRMEAPIIGLALAIEAVVVLFGTLSSMGPFVAVGPVRFIEALLFILTNIWLAYWVYATSPFIEIRVPVRTAAPVASTTTPTVLLPKAVRPLEIPASTTLARKKNVRRVLIAEKRDSNSLLVEVLQNAGHEARTIHDSRSALQALQSFRPDIFLIEADLPGESALLLAQKIRDEHLPRPLLVALITDLHDVSKISQSGFDYHLLTPVSVADLEFVLSKEIEI